MARALSRRRSVRASARPPLARRCQAGSRAANVAADAARNGAESPSNQSHPTGQDCLSAGALGGGGGYKEKDEYYMMVLMVMMMMTMMTRPTNMVMLMITMRMMGGGGF